MCAATPPRSGCRSKMRRGGCDMTSSAARPLRAGADRVAVGHTLDDQAETFSLKLIRGAGLTGLAGIYPRKDLVVRPLLDVSRAELRAFLTARNQAWREDESNDDLDNPRNRIRHVVLPELDRAYGGPVRQSIARATDLIREDAIWLDEASSSRVYGARPDQCRGIEFDAERLTAEPSPIVRRVLLMALKAVAGDRRGRTRPRAGSGRGARWCVRRHRRARGPRGTSAWKASLIKTGATTK